MVIEVAGQIEDVMRASLRCLTAERTDPHANADAESEYADEQLALAARDLVKSIDALPPRERPIGWDTD